MLKRFAILAALTLPLSLRADESPRTDAPKPASQRPLLQQLNQETQSLYHEVQSGVVRVQLPPPKWAVASIAAADEENPVRKWGAQLDATVKEKLEQEIKKSAKGQTPSLTVTVTPANTPAATTRPATNPTTAQTTGSAWSATSIGDNTVILHPGSQNSGALQLDAGGSISRDGQIIAGTGQLTATVVPGGQFTPNNIALLLDGEGHLLVPICVEKESFAGQSVPCMVGQNEMTTARFIASDRQTNISILQLEKPLGTPVKLSKARPAEGTLTMFLSPNSGIGRLMIWTNELRDWGVVVDMEGGIYGFARQGQFLSAIGCKPAIDQLIQSGAVKRARLGVGIAEIPQNDPARESNPALAAQPAVRINELAPNSLAEKAGLKIGDIILQLNDQPTGDPHSFAAAIATNNTKATLKLLRDKKPQTTTIDLPAE